MFVVFMKLSKKICKNYYIKTIFQTQFFNKSHNIKYNLIYYQTFYYFTMFISPQM